MLSPKKLVLLTLLKPFWVILGKILIFGQKFDFHQKHWFWFLTSLFLCKLVCWFKKMWSHWSYLIIRIDHHFCYIHFGGKNQKFWPKITIFGQNRIWIRNIIQAFGAGLYCIKEWAKSKKYSYRPLSLC